MLSLNITDATTSACRADKGNRDHPYLELCRIVDSESGKCDRKHTLITRSRYVMKVIWIL